MSRTKIPTQDKAITIRLTAAEKKRFMRHAKIMKMRDATAARCLVMAQIERLDALLTPPQDSPNA